MVPGKNITPAKVLEQIKANSIVPDFLESFTGPQLEYSLNNMNVYLMNFYLNDKLIVFAVCSADNNNDYTIRLWAPLDGDFSPGMVDFLFQKYLMYLEKFSMLNYINISLSKKTTAVMNLLSSNGFKVKDSGLLVRRRKV
jgi:hypothetical protein